MFVQLIGNAHVNNKEIQVFT